MGASAYAPTTSAPVPTDPSTWTPGVGALPTQGGAGQGPLLGSSAPGVGAAVGANGLGGPVAGPTQIGGGEALSGYGKGGGVGIESGGVADMAMQVGGMALDMMAPGAGQAAQTVSKLANRAIEYGGQVAGILTQGALDTWLPFGGSKLAQNNWLTRIVGGFAGAGAAIPNIAGKSSQALSKNDVDPNTQQHGTGGGQPPGPTYNTTINTNRDTIDGTARDWEHHLSNMNSAPGM
jgi:hypothetical protein